MKILDLSDAQAREFSRIFPEGNLHHYALVPEREYLLWRQVFQKLQREFFASFAVAPLVERGLRDLPIMQWVAKLVLPETMPEVAAAPGMLMPKSFKVAFLAERGAKPIGVQGLMLSLLDVLAGTLSIPTIPHAVWQPSEGFDPLGFVTPNGDLHLARYMRGARRAEEVKILDFPGHPSLIEYRGTRYDAVVPTNLYEIDFPYQVLLRHLHERGLLIPPLHFEPTSLRRWTKFRHPAWATVYPMDYFAQRVRENPQFDDYLLVRVDESTSIPYRWAEIQQDPALSLDLQMEEYWVWQERCDSPLPELTLYWTPCFKYPWLVERQTGSWIPVLISAGE